MFLPAATYLERTEPEWFKSDSWFPEITLRQKTVQVGEAKPDTQIMIELGRACGFVEEFPSEDITWYIDECLKPSGITYEQLLAHPHGLEYGNIEYEKFAKAGFPCTGRQGQHRLRGAGRKRFRRASQLGGQLRISP